MRPCRKSCSIDGCNDKRYCRGFCSKHYQRFSRYGHTNLPTSRSEQLFNEGRAFCSCCQTTKELEYFGEDKQTKTGKRRYCLECESEKSKEQYTKHRSRVRNAILKYRFGIELPDYNRIFESQSGVCKICGGPPQRRYLSVDHHHVTGKVRGLLCQNCNAGIGMFKENPVLLQAAITYLKKENNVEAVSG